MAKAQPDENQDFGSERIVVETRCNFFFIYHLSQSNSEILFLLNF